MYILQIHPVDDIPHPFHTTSSAAHGPKPSTNSENSNFSDITELKGVVHLFRNPSPATASLSSPSSRSTTLFIAAVPSYVSPQDFLLFCGSYLNDFSQLCFLRNDGMDDRYSVLITLVNQFTSDGFYCSFHGKQFRPSEDEVCHIYFTHSVVCYKFEEEAGLPRDGFVEMPTCPVCLGLSTLSAAR